MAHTVSLLLTMGHVADPLGNTLVGVVEAVTASHQPQRLFLYCEIETDESDAGTDAAMRVGLADPDGVEVPVANSIVPMPGRGQGGAPPILAVTTELILPIARPGLWEIRVYLRSKLVGSRVYAAL